MESSYLCCGLLWLAGLGLTVKAWETVRNRRALVRNGVRTGGWVVGHRNLSVDGDTGPDRYAAEVEYTVGGVQYRTLTDGSETPPKLGRRLPVTYERGNPANASCAVRTGDAYLFLAVAVAILAAGVFGVFALRHGLIVVVPAGRQDR